LGLLADSRLAVIREAPQTALTTQDGAAFRLSDLRGKVVLVGFVFTTCNGTCPATTHRMAGVAQALADAGLADKTHLVSVTLDPARDTPPVLRRYMRLFDIDAAHWTFLTGSEERVGKVLSTWDMWVRPAANGQFDHPSRVFLLDTHGRVREIYNLDSLRPKWVLEDVRLLLHEARGP
jgi:protein SCO1/2